MDKQSRSGASMEDVGTIFLRAFEAIFVDTHGAQKELASKTKIDPSYLNRILKGKTPGSDSTRRKIATALGYPGHKYEDFLEIGRAIQEGREPIESPPHTMTDEEMEQRWFISVPYSSKMELAAGAGGSVIPVEEDEFTSKIVVHGPSLGHRTAKNLQAFRVGGDSMEPLIAKNGIILADISHNDARKVKDGKIYVVCYDLAEGEGAVKTLRWAKKGEWLSIESANNFYPPVVKRVDEVAVIGKVIWSWREHG